MEDVRDLKELQIDALREVANIGAGHAATALSQLTNRRIMISVPQINIVRLEEVPDLLGNPQDVVAAVLMHMLGDLTGRTLLLFPEAVGRRVCDMLLRRPVGTTAVFDALEQSCLKEAGNILAGAYLNALSDFMGMLLLPSVPSLVVDGMLGQQEIVVKGFDAPHGTLPVFSGATIMGDGVPTLILDAGGLL